MSQPQFFIITNCVMQARPPRAFPLLKIKSCMLCFLTIMIKYREIINNYFFTSFWKCKYLFCLSTAGSKWSNICGALQILEMLIFMDISAVSETTWIKQRWFCHLKCMLFQIWHSGFHYLTTKLFCVAPFIPKINYPFK